MKTVTITCDGCKGTIEASNVPGYFLGLSAYGKPLADGPVAALHVMPPIDRDHHFCCLACLKKWLEHK